MVKFIKFIGSIYFTLLLIALFAAAVISGTVIESTTGSHKAASRLIYSNPLFLMILWGIFTNILLATFKRYPFKKRHIPFLITHLGLLMVFGGTLLKISFGLQGTISLKEGIATDYLALDETKALSFKKRGQKNWEQVQLERNFLSRLKTTYNKDKLSFFIKGLSPHGEEHLEMWIKKDKLVILGEPPLPLNTLGSIGPYSLIGADDHSLIKTKLKNLPALLFLKEENGDTTLLEVDEKGDFKREVYSPKIVPRLYAYDEGFGGYTVPYKLLDTEIETPLTRKFTPLPSPQKLEEERPIVSLQIKEGEETDQTLLAFGSPLPTSALKRELLLRFEPYKKRLPQTLRLREARAVFYPNSSQPQSYEAHLWYGNTPVKLSMNHVWESPEGYRFYLANMTPLDETAVKEVRLVVNRDPFKYYLTYPGALILALGIALLFLRKQKSIELYPKKA